MAPGDRLLALGLLAAAGLPGAKAQTSSTLITGISPTSVSLGKANTITVTGGGAGDKVAFWPTGGCGAVAPSDDLTSGTVVFAAFASGVHDCCARASGEADSQPQSGISLTVIAATANNLVTAISPLTMTVSLTQAFTLTASGSLTGTQAVFTTTGNCASATPNLAAGSGSISFTPGSAGAYDLCMQASGGSDSIAQTGISLTVVTATSPSVITAISIGFINLGVPTVITLTGTTNSGDKADFAAAGSCGSTTPASDPTGGSLTVTLSTAGTYDLCYRKNQGTDSIKQTAIALVVMAPTAGADPVAVYSGSRRDFALPPGVPVPLLRAADVALHGATFEGSGPWEQWFGQMVVAAPDGQQWVRVAIRKDLLSFNRSSARRGAFETLDVTLGRGSLTEPYALTTLPGVDVPIPVSFLGVHVLFRKMQRHYNTAFTTIGRARRECMDVSGATLHFFVCAAAAGEYYGSPDRHLAIKFAHLNLAVVEVSNLTAIEGLLPELWGLQPLSEEAAGYANKGAAALGKAPRQAEEPAAALHPASLAKGMAWAGGAGTEDLQKGCAEPNGTFAV